MLLRPKIPRIYSNVVNQLQNLELSIVFLTISRKYAYLWFFIQKSKNIIQISGLVPFYKCFKKPAAGAARFAFLGVRGAKLWTKFLKKGIFDAFPKSQEKGRVLLTIFQNHKIGVCFINSFSKLQKKGMPFLNEIFLKPWKRRGKYLVLSPDTQDTHKGDRTSLIRANTSAPTARSPTINRTIMFFPLLFIEFCLATLRTDREESDMKRQRHL